MSTLQTNRPAIPIPIRQSSLNVEPDTECKKHCLEDLMRMISERKVAIAERETITRPPYLDDIVYGDSAKPSSSLYEAMKAEMHARERHKTPIRRSNDQEIASKDDWSSVREKAATNVVLGKKEVVEQSWADDEAWEWDT